MRGGRGQPADGPPGVAPVACDECAIESLHCVVDLVRRLDVHGAAKLGSVSERGHQRGCVVLVELPPGHLGPKRLRGAGHKQPIREAGPDTERIDLLAKGDGIGEVAGRLLHPQPGLPEAGDVPSVGMIAGDDGMNAPQ